MFRKVTTVTVDHHPPDGPSSAEPVLDAGPGIFDRGPVEEEPNVAAVRFAKDSRNEIILGGFVSLGEHSPRLCNRHSRVPEKIRYGVRIQQAICRRRQHDIRVPRPGASGAEVRSALP
jgi:hypothetical protein